MGMDCHIHRAFGGMAVFERKRRCIGRQRLLNKCFEKKRALPDVIRVSDFQFAVVLCKHRVAGGLEKNYWRRFGRATQQFYVVLPELGGEVQIPLAERGTATTATSCRQHDFEA